MTPVPDYTILLVYWEEAARREKKIMLVQCSPITMFANGKKQFWTLKIDQFKNPNIIINATWEVRFESLSFFRRSFTIFGLLADSRGKKIV